MALRRFNNTPLRDAITGPRDLASGAPQFNGTGSIPLCPGYVVNYHSPSASSHGYVSVEKLLVVLYHDVFTVVGLGIWGLHRSVSRRVWSSHD